jgi:hypothetical protein
VRRHDLLTSQTFELLEVIGFRCEHILQADRQPFIAVLRRLIDPSRIVADDLPFGGDVLLQKIPGRNGFGTGVARE